MGDWGVNHWSTESKEKDNQVIFAIHAEEYGLLDTPGWNTINPFAKHEKMVVSIVNQAKFWTFDISPKFKNGHEIPQTPELGMSLGEKLIKLNGMVPNSMRLAMVLRLTAQYQLEFILVWTSFVMMTILHAFHLGSSLRW
jgi:hypothetical protein